MWRRGSWLGRRMNYQLHVSGFPDWVQRVTLRKAVVDQHTTAFSFNEVTVVEVDQEEMFLTRDIDVPSIHYLEWDFHSEAMGEEQG